MKKTVFSLLVILVSIFSNAQDERMPVPCAGNGSPENCSCSSVFTSCSTNCAKNEHGGCDCGIFVSTCRCLSDCPGSTSGSRTSVIVNEIRLTEFEKYTKIERRSRFINDFLNKLVTIREIYEDGTQVERLVNELAELIEKFSLADREVMNYYLQAIGDARRI